MKNKNLALGNRLRAALQNYSANVVPLLGISDPLCLNSLVEQLVESVRRVAYISVIDGRDISPNRADPTSEHFDPERAAILYKRQGNLDEACWLVFLAVHFGKNHTTGWRLYRDVYGRLGNGAIWSWTTTSRDPQAFKTWLLAELSVLKGGDGIRRRFGNHRKYQSLHPYTANGTGHAIESYIDWINQAGDHMGKLQQAAHAVGTGDPAAIFDLLYRSMDSVASFGRTAKFDYLTMLGKMGLANIAPGSTYMTGATGPYAGASLLFGTSLGANPSRRELDRQLRLLDTGLQVGMQAMEDALCNWQKSPAEFRPFRG